MYVWREIKTRVFFIGSVGSNGEYNDEVVLYSVSRKTREFYKNGNALDPCYRKAIQKNDPLVRSILCTIMHRQS
ncbi:uncharacterized protein OCT59_001564 [Rhizophagus irregularis]|uniref:uncharacterized protein n=1 Tax=Rhizophagus irregularis TaxID=588596 RepID=UPI000CC29AAF|nr:hypothetical protein OCT59_001564 [Rhizophagus irregularis]